MNRTDNELRELLGLRADDVLGVAQSIGAADTGTGHGFAAVALDEDLEAVTAANPDWTPLAVSVPGAEVSRWDHDGRVFRIDRAAVRGVIGTVVAAGDGFLLDARRGRTVATVVGWDEDGAGWERAFVAVNDLVVREVLRAATPEWVRALQGPDPVPAVPGPPDVFGALVLEDWLQAAVDDLHALGGTHRRVAALGVVARLWAPADTDGRMAWAAAVRAGTTPLLRLRAWASGADRAIFEATSTGVASEVEGWLDALDELRETRAAAEPRREAIGRLLRSRDDLEGAALACRFHGGPSVAASLEVLDAAAVGEVDLLAAGGPIDDARLAVAATAAPESWWTAFGS